MRTDPRSRTQTTSPPVLEVLARRGLRDLAGADLRTRLAERQRGPSGRTSLVPPLAGRPHHTLLGPPCHEDLTLDVVP